MAAYRERPAPKSAIRRRIRAPQNLGFGQSPGPRPLGPSQAIPEAEAASCPGIDLADCAPESDRCYVQVLIPLILHIHIRTCEHDPRLRCYMEQTATTSAASEGRIQEATRPQEGLKAAAPDPRPASAAAAPCM